MSLLFNGYCRTYQKIIYLACFILDFHEPEMLQGVKSISKLPSFIKEKGIHKVLIVTDPGLMKIGLLNNLFESLDSAKIEYALYDKTVANPTIDNVEEALLLYKEKACDGIIAFGGGSPMDCAKGVGARIARPNKSLQKMKGVLTVLKKLPPIIAIPTTAGTGSETTLAAIITDAKSHFKYLITDPVLIPKYAVLDPELTVKLPKHITSTTGMDALTHAVEAYIGHSNTKRTTKLAEEATKLIFDNIKNAYDNGDDIVARENMQIASFKAGAAFTRAYVGIVHAIAHSLGGQYGIPHGLANAIILPYVLDWYGKYAYKPLSKLADIVGIKEQTVEEKAKAFIAAIREYNDYMNIPRFVKDLKVGDKIINIDPKDIPIMAEHAFKESNPLYPVPKIMKLNEYVDMYYTISDMKK